MLALLCTLVQTTWAQDVWDGSTSRPTYLPGRQVIIIRTAAELAYAQQHWDDDSGDGVNKDYYEHSYMLEADLDLTAYSWQPLGFNSSKPYTGTFFGNGHTIKLNIIAAADNYQGLFSEISPVGCVENLHVSGHIECSTSRLVGGIAGQNNGLISNCWVSSDVISYWRGSSNTAKVGGICGENLGRVEYCCMTGDVLNHDADVGGIVGYNNGNINHCTFYGTRTSNHSQDNEFVGDQSENLWNAHGRDLYDDATLANYLNSFSSVEYCEMYRSAIQYPNRAVVRNEGYGEVTSASLGTHEGKTMRLTKAFGSLQSISVTDARGSAIALSGNETDGYTFTMPRGDVVVLARFSGSDWLSAYAGTQSDPYVINSTDDWAAFAYYVGQGNDFSGKVVKLGGDVTITTTVGLREQNEYGRRPFSGTFLGEGHTLTANLSSTATGTSPNEQGVAPFHCISDATIKDLTVAGTISSSSYHTAGLVGFAYGFNLLEKCIVTATLNINSNYAGGIVGHGEISNTTFKDCVFAGTINGVGGQRANIGGLWGWSDSGSPLFQNCIEKGTYNNISSMHPVGLTGSKARINDCYYHNAQIGTPDLVCVIPGAYQVQASVPQNKVYYMVQVADGTTCYLPCELSGLQQKYFYTGRGIEPDVAITCKGVALVRDVDYTVSYANNTNSGRASVTYTGHGKYGGRDSEGFTIGNVEYINGWWDWNRPNLDLTDGMSYEVVCDKTFDDVRIKIQGHATLILSEGITFTINGGIELSEGNTLTIEGPGNLVVKGSYEMAGIGASRMGTLIINGGNINVTGGQRAAGIGGNLDNSYGGRVVINGGVVRVTGGPGAAGIGGGDKTWNGSPDSYCGDVVINGGQVTVIAGANSPAIGHGSRSPNSGTLTLGWTNPSDYLHTINAGFGVTSVTFVDGKQFVIEGTTTIATASNAGNQKIVPYIPVGALPGSGTQSDPYTISSADEWEVFTKNVGNSYNYSGKFVELRADISVTQKCGSVTGSTPVRAFSGTFLGGGHTITMNISDWGNQGTALFSYINGATIKNLTVAGTVTASQYHTAGIVGFADGTNLIEGCTVTAQLNIRSDYAGGFVGHGRESNTTIKDCIFAGTIAGLDANRGNVAGIWGWCGNGSYTIDNCMECGTYSRISSFHPIGLQGDKGTISRCYYLNPVRGITATTSGAYQVSSEPVEGEVSKQLRLLDGKTYYVPCLISNIEEFYELAQGGTLSITPAVKSADGTQLSSGTDYTVALDGGSAAASTASVTTKGEHTLVVAGTGSCSGSKSFSFRVIDPIEGEGTAEKPYLIRNTDEWELFALLVNRGTNDFSGQYVKLGTDLSVTTMVGVSANTPFKGTFLGDGKTLTFNIGSASAPYGEEFCAPFRYVNGATIRNLKVAGNIYSNRMRAAGLVGSTAGTTTIADCQVSTVIHSSTGGDGSHGGIVGMPTGPLNITNCIYDGRLLTSNNTMHCGGFVGWHNGQSISITSSLYAPNTALAVSDGEKDITVGATFVRGTDVGTDCFYTQPLDAAQGTRVYTEALAGELCMRAQAADGKWYYLPVTLSDIRNTYIMEGASLSITPTIAGYGETNPAITTDFTATLNGSPASFPLTITAAGDYTLVLTAVEGSDIYSGSKSVGFVVCKSFDGEGTAENPFLIGSEADWNFFAANVAEGENYAGKFLKLNADISVSTMLGTSSTRSFSGTFLGSDDHTLTFTCGSAEAPFGEEYCAPFRYVNGADIQNLKVAGDIYTSRKFAAGLVAASYGSTTFTGCRVSIAIHSSVSGEGTHGGFAAVLSGGLTVKDCIYDGCLLTTNGTTQCGGFVGLTNNQTVDVTSSLYAPNTALTVADGETPITVGATFVLGGNVGNYCYYTTPLGNAQGTMVYATRPEGELCMQAKAADNKMYYLPCTVGGVVAAYAQEENASITPTVTGLDNAALTFGTDFTATLDGTDVASLPISVTEKGDHTLVLTGKGDNYSGSKTLTFAVSSALEGLGTAESPYLISSTNDWTLFATKVASGMDYNGKYVRLDADITITTPVGSVPGAAPGGCFSGTFLGGGHTLTADIANTNAQGAAPFRYIKNSTIQNLNVAGTIAADSLYTGGLVGFADGTNVIGQCTVTATLNVASDYSAGFVGNGMSSATTLRNCIFAGAINGVVGSRSNMAGIWGLGGTPTLENCLEKGTYTNIGSLHPIGLQNAAGAITGCFYRTPQKGQPYHACTVSGAYLVSATAAEGEISKRVTAVDGATYYMSCTVRGVESVYPKSNEAITLTPTVTAADGTVLTAGTDFTYATDPATVKDAGDYTLTITAQGNTYTGTKEVPFSVSNDVAVTSSSTELNSGVHTVYENVKISSRIKVNGDVVLNLGPGTCLTAPKGIELSKGNKLTINGPGKLEILNCDEDKSAIGAVEVGTLIINGGDIAANGGTYAAGIGGDKNNISGGSITINGGHVLGLNTGFFYAPGIGGGYDDQEGHYGVCGDIVINGGQVTASSGMYGFGQGYQRGKDRIEENDYTSGTLTLGWSKPDDYIHDCSLLSMTRHKTNVESVTFFEGRKFIIQRTNEVCTMDNIYGETLIPLLAPTNTGNNSELISSCDGMKLPVMLDGRTLYKDGAWNTICLPFNLTLSGSPLDGAVARPLSAASISNDKTTLNLEFGDAVTELVAGTPYIIKWPKADDYVNDDAHNIVNPLFRNATIDATDRSYDNGESADSHVRFIGTYDGMSFNTKDYSYLFMGSENTLYYPSAGAGIGAQRAYFKIGEDGVWLTRALTAFDIDFGGGENVMGIISTSAETRDNEGWYTIDGRKFNGKPTVSGVYVNKGRKVLIK